MTARDQAAKLIDERVRPLLDSGALPPMWSWWLPLADEILEACGWQAAWARAARRERALRAALTSSLSFLDDEAYERAQAALAGDGTEADE